MSGKDGRSVVTLHSRFREILDMPLEKRRQCVSMAEARELGLELIDGAGFTIQFVGTAEELQRYRFERCGIRPPYAL